MKNLVYLRDLWPPVNPHDSSCALFPSLPLKFVQFQSSILITSWL